MAVRHEVNNLESSVCVEATEAEITVMPRDILQKKAVKISYIIIYKWHLYLKHISYAFLLLRYVLIW